MQNTNHNIRFDFIVIPDLTHKHTAYTAYILHFVYLFSKSYSPYWQQQQKWRKWRHQQKKSNCPLPWCHISNRIDRTMKPKTPTITTTASTLSTDQNSQPPLLSPSPQKRIYIRGPMPISRTAFSLPSMHTEHT